MLLVEAEKAVAALDPPEALLPFLTRRGGDIRLRYRERRPARPAKGEPLFDSGGVWRVERSGSRLVYSFSTRKRRPPRHGPAYPPVAVLGVEATLRDAAIRAPSR